jgi:hypothetical protein
METTHLLPPQYLIFKDYNPIQNFTSRISDNRLLAKPSTITGIYDYLS